jgi:hypothetical protein
MLGETLLKLLEIKLAIRIYRDILHDVGMVMNLERLESCDELMELKGHVAVLFNEFDYAQVAVF